MWTTATTECFKMMLNFVKEEIVDDRIWKIGVSFANSGPENTIIIIVL